MMEKQTGDRVTDGNVIYDKQLSQIDSRLKAVGVALEEPKTSAHHKDMTTDITRAELDAKLETVEVRMDARVQSISAEIKAVATAVGALTQEVAATRADNKNLKTVVLTTALGSVITIILGVAAFNATLLSNMLSAFESGRGNGASLTEQKVRTDAIENRMTGIDDKLDKLIKQSTPPPEGGQAKK